MENRDQQESRHSTTPVRWETQHLVHKQLLMVRKYYPEGLGIVTYLQMVREHARLTVFQHVNNFALAQKGGFLYKNFRFVCGKHI